MVAGPPQRWRRGGAGQDVADGMAVLARLDALGMGAARLLSSYAW